MLSANGFQEFLKALVHNSDTLTVWFFQAIAIWITDLCLKKVRITSFFWSNLNGNCLIICEF